MGRNEMDSRWMDAQWPQEAPTPLKREDTDEPDWFIVEEDEDVLESPESFENAESSADIPAWSEEFAALCDAHKACQACKARIARREDK